MAIQETAVFFVFFVELSMTVRLVPSSLVTAARPVHLSVLAQYAVHSDNSDRFHQR